MIVGKLKVGAKVSWVSQAQGCGVQKIGTVVVIVPSEFRVRDLLDAFDSHSIQFDGGVRDHESYLVEVKTGKDGRGKPKLYWPRVSALEKTK